MSRRPTFLLLLSAIVGLHAVSAICVQREFSAETALGLDRAMARETAERVKSVLDQELESDPNLFQ